MTRLTGFVFIIDVMLIGFAGMMAVDSFMTEDRKETVRSAINEEIDASADRYEQRREDGCRRRCDRNLSLDLDGQVRIDIVALAEMGDIARLLAGFDLPPVVADLPRVPRGFAEGVGTAAARFAGQKG